MDIEKLWNTEMIESRRVHLNQLLLGVDEPKIERQIARAVHIGEQHEKIRNMEIGKGICEERKTQLGRNSRNK